MKVVNYIARRLAQEGIEKVFLVQGAANNDLIYAIADEPDIDYVCPMHEQAAGFMAEGYAKVKGVPGCVVATSGPGGQNLLTPLANFYYDSVPGIFITGQVNSKFMRPADSSLRQLGFQEWPAAEVVRPLTKRAVLITDPQRVPEELEMALQLCQIGRPGPVWLDIPIDVQRAELKAEAFTVGTILGNFLSSRNLHSSPNTITSFLNDFWRAQRPAIMVGGGVRTPEQRRALEALLETLSAPAFPTWNALDVVPSNHPLYGGRIGTYGGPGRNFAIQNCDLLLAIGCRLSGRITGGVPESFARGARRYVVDIDPGLLEYRNQPQPFHVSCLESVQHFCDQLRMAYYHKCCSLGAQPAPPPDLTEWKEQVDYWRERYDPAIVNADLPCERVNLYNFARELSEVAPDNAIIITDCGGNVVVMNQAFRTKRGQRFFSNNGNSPMGFSFAAAIGAWFAAPDRPIICVIGDGGFNMNIQELQTLVNYGARVKTFILDNRIYGITHAFQARHYGDRFEASGPKGYDPPDFVAISEAYGVSAKLISSDWMLADEIQRALAIDVCLRVVRCPNFATYQPGTTGWADPIEDMDPKLPRTEFRANMIGVDPMPGWETGDYGKNPVPTGKEMK